MFDSDDASDCWWIIQLCLKTFDHHFQSTRPEKNIRRTQGKYALLTEKTSCKHFKHSNFRISVTLKINQSSTIQSPFSTNTAIGTLILRTENVLPLWYEVSGQFATRPSPPCFDTNANSSSKCPFPLHIV